MVRHVKVATVVATAAVAGLLLATSGVGHARVAALEPGTHRIELLSDGRLRSYVVFVPPQAEAFRSLALIMSFHGGGSHAEQQQDLSRMDRLARKEGFAVVYPNGTGVLETRLLTWNAGTCCGYAQKHRVDDVAFSLAVIEDVSRRIRIDRRRVFATGMSNGGMMAHRLGAEAASTIAAVAPVAGGMVTNARPSRPMPVMHFHSVDDPRALYDGGLGPPHPLSGSRVLHPSIPEVMQRWARIDGCARRATTGPTTKRGEHTATRITYTGCRGKASVVHWKLTGAGHVRPGGKQDVREELLGAPTQVVDANAEMWRFFKRHPLPT